jgi:hypothetical protein
MGFRTHSRVLVISREGKILPAPQALNSFLKEEQFKYLHHFENGDTLLIAESKQVIVRNGDIISALNGIPPLGQLYDLGSGSVLLADWPFSNDSNGRVFLVTSPQKDDQHYQVKELSSLENQWIKSIHRFEGNKHLLHADAFYRARTISMVKKDQYLVMQGDRVTVQEDLHGLSHYDALTLEDGRLLLCGIRNDCYELLLSYRDSKGTTL